MRNNDIEKMLQQQNIGEPSPELRERVLSDAAVVVPEAPEAAPKQRGRRRMWMMVAMASVFVVLALAGTLTGVGLYNEEYMQIYFDVNPSLCITVNRFDVVNGVRYINDDATITLGDVKLKGKSREEATEIIISELGKRGYFDDGVLYVSVCAKNEDGQKQLGKQETAVNNAKEHCGYSCEVVCDSYDKKGCDEAAKHGLSPAKYELINEIMRLDSSYSKEELQNKNMKQLKTLHEELKHGGSHGDPGGNHEETPGGAHEETPGGSHENAGGSHDNPGGSHGEGHH